MLHAWIRGKHRDRTEYEDEIVSAIFGPLRYLPTAAVIDWICAFDSRLGPASRYSSCAIKLWPNLGTLGRCEPDVVVTLTMGDQRETVLMIEAKWNSQQSKDQLSTQYKSARTRHGEGTEILHVYLTRRSESMFDMLGREHPRPGHHLINMTWMNAFGKARRVYGRKSLLQWQADTVEFLSKLGEHPFSGFDTITCGSDLQIPAHFFSGEMDWRTDYEPPETTPIFFQSEMEA